MRFIQSVDKSIVVNLWNKLDYAIAYELIEEIRSFTYDGVERINIYCSELENITSAGNKVIVFIKKNMDLNIDFKIYMHNVIQSVKDVLVLSVIDRYVEFVD